jgi:type I restriction enzyme S subunit
MSGVAESIPKYLMKADSNAIPSGYKQTEVGVIPADWDAVCLGDVSEVRMCKRILSEQTQKIGAIPFFKIGTFGGEPDAYIPQFLYEDFRAKYSFPDKGDILISAAGTLGKSVIYDGRPAYFQDSNIVWLKVNQRKLLNEYLYHYYKVIKWASSEGSTIARLYNGIIRASMIALPATLEQSAIANALSDVDALISELEKLIAKKEAIKTATMQQLLTGRTRLPQFALREDGTPKGTKPSELGEIPEDWEVVELGSVIEKFIGGGTPSRSNGEYWGNQIPWVTVKDFATFNPYSAQESITKKGLISSASNLIPKGTLITSTRMALGKAVIYQVDVAINQDMKALVCGQKLSTEFLYFWFEANKNKIDELGSGSTVKGLSLPDLRKVSFLLPPKQEQTAIATILSDMDEEIQALEQRLSKTRQIKQGMMQELLTGKTRLINAKEAAYDQQAS